MSASAPQTGLSQAEPEVSALRASIPSAWRCGHPRTSENTKVVRAGKGIACKTCFREHNRKWIAEKRAKAREQ